MPNFVIIGAAKAGTTSLYRYLCQHPQVYMSPVKEPRFFAFKDQDIPFQGPGIAYWRKTSVTSLAEYEALFRPTCEQSAVGEASPLYLYSKKACREIGQLAPEAKLIAILRHPVDRAYSHFAHNRASNVEPLSSFREALREEAQRRQQNWGAPWYYRDRGYYYRQLRTYYDTFRRDQIGVWLYDDLKTNAARFLSEIESFLAVDHAAIDTTEHHNVTRLRRKDFLGRVAGAATPLRRLAKVVLPHGLRTHIRNRVDYVRPTVSETLRRQLTKGYHEDILALQNLLGRDLSHWLE